LDEVKLINNLCCPFQFLENIRKKRCRLQSTRVTNYNLGKLTKSFVKPKSLCLEVFFKKHEDRKPILFVNVYKCHDSCVCSFGSSMPRKINQPKYSSLFITFYVRFCAGCRQSQKIHTQSKAERDGSGVSTWMIYVCGGCRIMHFWLVWHETKASWFPPLLRRRRGEGPSRWGEGRRRRHPSSSSTLVCAPTLKHTFSLAATNFAFCFCVYDQS